MNTMRNSLTPNFKPQTSEGFPCSVLREPCSGNWYVDQRRTGWDAMFTFSGKERDQETGYGYFGARYYDSDLSIWLSVDPMARKYPSLSPYVYCANNPVKLVDPDGRDIYVFGEDGSSTLYTPGMKYSGDDKGIAAKIDNLNAINETKNGEKVISKLSISENMYSVMDSDKGSEFIEYNINTGAEGGTIALEDNNIEKMAHELFHGYQSEMGSGGSGSILNEVEARLFQYSIAAEIDNSTLYSTKEAVCASTTLYNTSVANLLSSSSLPVGDLRSVVNGFKEFSNANNSGGYNSYPKFNKTQMKTNAILIGDFFPLK